MVKIGNNKIQYVNCSFCRSEKSKIIFHDFDYNIVKCKKCKFSYTNPRPVSEELSSLYNEDYFQSNERFSGLYSKDEEINFSQKKIEEIENWFDSPKKILEIGCAEGELLNLLSIRGWDVEGIDISKQAVENGKKKYNLKLHNDVFESFNFIKKFDVIAMYQSLEHMENPKLVIDRCFDLINKNGVIIIEVPNINSFDTKISKKRKLLNYDLPYHLSHFSPKFLKRELKKLGFEIVYIDYYQSDFVIGLIKILNKVFKKNTTYNNDVNESSVENTESKNQKIKKSWKIKLLSSIAFLFPGWRFTIIAKK